MKEIYAIFALLWLGVAVMSAIIEHDKETAFLAFIIALQNQSLLYQSDDHKKKE